MPNTAPTSTLAAPSFDKPVKLLIVVAPTHKDVTDPLIAGASAAATACGADVEIIEMPGAAQVPSAIAMAERMQKFDGYVALGCILADPQSSGEAGEIARALMMMGLGGACIGNGIVVAQTHAQATQQATEQTQAGGDIGGETPNGAHNKGGQAALAALHLVALSRKWARSTTGIGFRA